MFIDILIISYVMFNVLMFGLSSAILAGSNDSFIQKLVISILILAFGFLAVVLYVLLPLRFIGRLQSRLQKRNVSKNKIKITKLKAIL